MKLWTFLFCFLFLAPGLLGSATGLQGAPEPDTAAERELRVVPGSDQPHSPAANSKLDRLAAAFSDIRSEEAGKSRKKSRETRKLIPAADLGFSLGQGIGKAVNWLPSKLRIPLAHNPQEETSLGLGLATLGYGIMSGRARTKRFEQMRFALQQKYKMNGIYLASLEDENIEVRYCNKRLQKTLDKATRHRKDMLAKLHLSITPN